MKSSARVLTAVVAALAALGPAAGNAAAAETSSGPVTYVTSQATLSPGGFSTVQAACPGSTSVSGGGSELAGKPDTFDQFEIGSMYPADGVDAGSVPDDIYATSAYNDDGDGHRLRVTAICVKPSAADLTYSSATGVSGGGSSSTASAQSCPSGSLTGSGLSSNAADAHLFEVEELGLGFNGNKPVASQLTYGFSKEGAPALNYRADLICTEDKVKHAYRAKVLFGIVRSLKVSCPAGSRVLGGGFSRFPVDLIASAPFDGRDKDRAPDDGWKIRITTSGPIAGIAFANCLS